MITKRIDADLLSTNLKYLAHGASLNLSKNSDITKQIFTTYPLAHYHYKHLRKAVEVDPKLELGLSVGVIVVHKFYCLTTMLILAEHKDDPEKFKLNVKAIEENFKKVILYKPVGPVAISARGWGFDNNYVELEKLLNNITQNKLELWVYN